MAHRIVSFEAERPDPVPLQLMQSWVEGVAGDVTFDLVCGAGVGNACMRLTVQTPEGSITELVDIRAGLTEWVERIAGELARG